MEATGQDRETVSAKLAGMTKEEKAALRKNAQVAAILARIKAVNGVLSVERRESFSEADMEA